MHGVGQLKPETLRPFGPVGSLPLIPSRIFLLSVATTFLRSQQVLALLLIVFIPCSTLADEPEIDGRPLTDWLLTEYNSPRGDKVAANDKLRALGTNALPSIIQLLEAPYSRATSGMTLTRDETLLQACVALINLGDAATNSFAVLTKVYTRDAPREVRALLAFGFAAWRTAPEVLYTQLLADALDSDPDLLSCARAAVQNVRIPAQSAIPVLIKALDNHRFAVSAVTALASYRADAAPAEARLVELLSIPHEVWFFHKEVEKALHAISPAKYSLPDESIPFLIID